MWPGRLSMAAAMATLCLRTAAGAGPTSLALHVAGADLVDGSGNKLALRGVNFSGAQFMCTKAGRQVWDIPADKRAVSGMQAWHVNAVRVPLNEDCWLGINRLPRGYSAAVYRQAVHDWVAQLHEAGFYVLLNLHVVAPGRKQSLVELPMADADHAGDFWRSVASDFQNDAAVVFDLYNEPKHLTWDCWLHGCELRYRTAGMQDLLDAVRATGAGQAVMADGINYANDLSGWLAHQPRDPLGQLAAGFHAYGDGLGCEDSGCWDQTVAAVAAHVPVISGEIGEFDCTHRFIDAYMNWADPHGVSYLAWAWNTYSCAREPSLLALLDGTPSPYGRGYHDHLLSVTQAAH